MGGMGGMGGTMGGGECHNLKNLDPEDRVQAISHCKDTYTITTANGQAQVLGAQSPLKNGCE